MSPLKKILCIVLAVVIVASLTVTIISFASLAKGINFGSFEEHINQNISKAQKYALYLTKTEGGNVVVPENIKDNEEVTIKASPEPGYAFLGWYNKNGKYISSTGDYTFVLSEDTYILAKFVSIPAELSGSFSKNEVSSSVSTDFSFNVKCNESSPEDFLKNNLVIYDIDYEGTQHQIDSENENAFTLQSNGNGTYVVSPISEYKAGCTYVAKLKPDSLGVVTFNDTDATSLTFSVKKQETKILETKNDIVYLSSATDLYSEPTIDSVCVNSDKGIGVGTLICIYSGELDENGKPIIDDDTIFGKCTSVSSISGHYEIGFDLPSLSEIYEKFDIYSQKDVNFGELENTSKLVSDDDMKAYLLSQEDVQNLIAKVYYATSKQFLSSDYGVRQLTNISDSIDVSVQKDILGPLVLFNITMKLNLDVFEKSTNQNVADINFDILLTKTLSLSELYSLESKTSSFSSEKIYSVDIETKVSTVNQINMLVDVKYDDSMADLGVTKESVKQACLKYATENEIKSLKEVFKSNGYVSNQKEITLLSFKHNTGSATFVYDIKLAFEYDFDGGLFLEDGVSSSQTTFGIRSVGNEILPFYSTTKTGNLGSSHTYFGNSSFTNGTSMNVQVFQNGFKKYINATLDVKDNILYDFNGFVSLENGLYSGSSQLSGQSLGNTQYNIFEKSDNMSFDSGKDTILHMGVENSVLNYTYSNKIQNSNYSVSIGKDGLDLTTINDLSVNILSSSKGVYSQNLDENILALLDVSFEKGNYLTYSNGKVSVSNDAPTSFVDKLVITSNSINKWTSYVPDSYILNIPTVEFVISYDYKNPALSSDSELEAQFRTIYQNYSEATSQKLSSILKNLTTNSFDSSITEDSMFTYVLNEYVDQLFAEIKRCKAQVDSDYSIENKFVKDEASAFEFAIDFAKDLTKENPELDKEKVIKALNLIEKSNVLYSAIITIEDNEHYQEIVDLVKVDESTKQQIKDIIEEYVSQSSNPERANKIKSTVINLIDKSK